MNYILSTDQEVYRSQDWLHVSLLCTWRLINVFTCESKVHVSMSLSDYDIIQDKRCRVEILSPEVQALLGNHVIKSNREKIFIVASLIMTKKQVHQHLSVYRCLCGTMNPFPELSFFPYRKPVLGRWAGWSSPSFDKEHLHS